MQHWNCLGNFLEGGGTDQSSVIGFWGTILGASIAGIIGLLVAWYTTWREQKRIDDQRRHDKREERIRAIGAYCSKKLSIVETISLDIRNARGFLLDHVAEIWQINAEKFAAYTHASVLCGEELLEDMERLDEVFEHALEGVRTKQSNKFFKTLTARGQTLIGLIYQRLERTRK